MESAGVDPAGPGRVVKAVRGAIQVPRNEPEPIAQAAVRLVQELLGRNAVAEADVVSMLFTLTPDLDRANPAAAARTLGFAATPLLCVQEAFIQGQMPRVIRLLLTFRCPADREPRPVYLEGAEALRPDLAL